MLYTMELISLSPITFSWWYYCIIHIYNYDIFYWCSRHYYFNIHKTANTNLHKTCMFLLMLGVGDLSHNIQKGHYDHFPQWHFLLSIHDGPWRGEPTVKYWQEHLCKTNVSPRERLSYKPNKLIWSDYSIWEKYSHRPQFVLRQMDVHLTPVYPSTV